ncbi:Type IV pilus inner membrane component PilO [Gammaproteobacteria bacterium]
MNLADINNLDFNNIGSWPFAAKIGMIVITCIVILGAGYWFDTQYRINDWDEAQVQEETKRKEFVDNQKKAASLDILKQQMADLEESFNIMLKQLPSKAEVDALLVDISQTGIAAGLQFELFKPGVQVSQDFRNQPIQIVVTGTYHQFGQFVSGVAALPRIVTLHDVSLNVISNTEKTARLRMDAVAKIYHYSNEETKK